MQILEELGDAVRPEGVSLVDLGLAIALVAVAFPAARLIERTSRAAMRRLPSLSPEMGAVAMLPIVKRQPPPQVIVSGLSNGVVALSVRFWFEPQGRPERMVLDTVTRMVHAALRDAGVELQPPRLAVDVGEAASAAGVPVAGDASSASVGPPPD